MVVHFQAQTPKLTEHRSSSAGGVEGPRPDILVHVDEVAHRSVHPARCSIIQPCGVHRLHVLGYSLCLHRHGDALDCRWSEGEQERDCSRE